MYQTWRLIFVTMNFSPNLSSAAVINLLKDLCAKPGVDCTNLITSFTGNVCVYVIRVLVCP